VILPETGTKLLLPQPSAVMTTNPINMRTRMKESPDKGV
jgi:hypothetical protein